MWQREERRVRLNWIKLRTVSTNEAMRFLSELVMLGDEDAQWVMGEEAQVGESVK